MERLRQPLLVSEKQSDCPFVWYQNVRSALFGFVTKHACGGSIDGQTDERTDRQTDRITTANTTLAYLLAPYKLHILKLLGNVTPTGPHS